MRDERREARIDDAPEPVDGGPARVALAALAPLTPQQRAIVFLFYYADLSIAEIAQATGSSRVAVRVQLHRARESLRRRYGTASAMRTGCRGGIDEHELV
jgi:RNA polymerase sigma-70 factor (ECF subfamily)